MRVMRRFSWHGPPLALQIVALLLAVLFVAQLVTLLLTLLLPPAPQPQYGLDDIAAALAEDAEGNGLQRTVQAGPPDIAGPGWLVSERSRTDLAKMIGVPISRVTLAFYTPLPFAGTTAMRNVAFVDDGSVNGFGDAAFAGTNAMPNMAFVEDGPVYGIGHAAPPLLLAQFTAPQPGPGGPMVPGMPRGGQWTHPPTRDALPPGFQRDREGNRWTFPQLPPAGGVRTAERPLISIEPHPGGGTYIPGDNGAA